MTKTQAAAGSTFDDQTESMMDWTRANARMIGIIAGAVVLAAVLWFVVQQWRERRAIAAEVAMNRARESYASGNLPLAQTDLRRVIERYGSSAAGSQASMLLAQTFYEQDKPDSGLKVLNAGHPSDVDEAAYEALKGAGLEQKKEYVQAAERYQAAAGKAVSAMAKDRYRADAARVLALGGKKDEAVSIWQSLANDPQSNYSAEARVRLGELTATAVAK